MSTNPYAPPSAPLIGPPGLSSGPVYAYRPAGGLVFWLTLALVTLMLADGLVTASSAVAELAYPGFLDEGNFDESEALPLMALGALIVFAALGLAVTYIACVVLFCMTIFRFSKNARALGSKGLEYTPGWAVGWFFIPIANLFMPYKVTSEIYRASDPKTGDFDWRQSAAPALLGWWWGAWIVSNILDNVEARLAFGQITLPPEASVGLSLVTFALTVVSGFLAISVVRSIHARLEEKANFSHGKPPIMPQGFGDYR